MIGILLGWTIATYWIGYRLERKKQTRMLALSLVGMGATIFFFKIWKHGSLMPPGISFYLFQMAAWMIDIYRGTVKSEKNFVTYTGKLLMFPKILSGPLAEPRKLDRQEASWNHPGSKFYRGIQELVLGLTMKVLVADRMAGLWSQAGVIGYESISPAFAWMALLAFALQLYLDFWGYSLMAMGLGRMIGFKLPRNFDDPYCSRSISEFYRRWHITLGAWFRNYIYIPLGGNRKGTARTLLNLAVVWLLTGLWHGIGPGYLIWAGFLLFFILNERLWLGKILQKSKLFSHVYTVLVILLSWIPFAVGDVEQMITYVGRLVGCGGTTLNPLDFWVIGKEYIPMLLGGALLATGYPGKIWRKIRKSRISDGIILILFWLVLYGIATMEQSSFFYFQY